MAESGKAKLNFDVIQQILGSDLESVDADIPDLLEEKKETPLDVSASKSTSASASASDSSPSTSTFEGDASPTCIPNANVYIFSNKLEDIRRDLCLFTTPVYFYYKPTVDRENIHLEKFNNLSIGFIGVNPSAKTITLKVIDDRNVEYGMPDPDVTTIPAIDGEIIMQQITGPITWIPISQYLRDPNAVYQIQIQNTHSKGAIQIKPREVLIYASFDASTITPTLREIVSKYSLTGAEMGTLLGYGLDGLNTAAIKNIVPYFETYLETILKTNKIGDNIYSVLKKCVANGAKESFKYIINHTPDLDVKKIYDSITDNSKIIEFIKLV